MVKRRAGVRGFALLGLLLAGGALLHAQPTINGPNANPPGLQSSSEAATFCSGPTNGAAITAGTQTPSDAICLYVNGNFTTVAPGATVTNTVTWTSSGPSPTVTTLTPFSVSATQIVLEVQGGLYQNAGTAGIQVTQVVQVISQPPVTTLSNVATYTINPSMSSPGGLPQGYVGVAYSQPFFTGGTPPFTFVGGGGTPPGLGFATATGNLLTGTPTQVGSFGADPDITDSWGNTLTPDDSISIFTLLQITPTVLPNGVLNVPYPNNVTLNGSGGGPPYNWSATGLPTGLQLNQGSGALTGTPQQVGLFNNIVVTLTDTTSQTATAIFSINIAGTLLINSTILPNGRINTLYPSTAFTAFGGVPAENAWSALGLPAGLAINPASGVVSGTPTQSGSFNVTITVTNNNPVQTASVSLPLTIVPTLVITTASLPSGTTSFAYGASLSGSGGALPYVWSATGLPPGLGLNAASGAISGTPTQTGSFIVSVTLTDNAQMDPGGQTAKAFLDINISSPAPPPVQITTSSLPNGTVGVFYASLIGVSGGNGGPYTFVVTGATSTGGVLAGGAGLPPGLQVANNGQLQGTPTAPGSFSFGVTATDTAGNSGSGTVSITIVAAPLVITTGALGSVQVGSSVGITFAATGGVPPLTFSLGGSAPAGTTFASKGTLSGTVTTAGSYTFTVTVTDSVKTTASKSFTLVVTPAPLTIATTSLANGQAGVAYAGQFAAAGGTPPYAWSGSAGGGLNISSTGAISGTPTVAGTYTVSVSVTDSLGAKASGSFTVIVTPSGLTVTTTSLPNGALTAAYSASLSASGGTPPYTWSVGGLPAGITASSSGALSGTPTSPGAFTVSVTVKDSLGVSASANLSLTVLQAPLKITTTGITPPTLDASFSTGFGATGGTPPYTWTATGLPAGVTMSSTGTLSGTPTALGATSITVNVTDSSGQQASETLSLTVILPVAPGLTLTGLPATANAGTQSTATVTLSPAYPVDVTVTLTLTFTPLSGADDPNIQFSTGGRTATLTVKAGATTSTTSVGVQTGTVAGTITVTSQLVASGQNITPTPPPTKTIVIGPAAPSITSVAGTTNSTGFTVTIDGFDPTRAVTQVVFTFAASAGSNLQTTSVTVSAAALFSAWYQSSAATAFGSQFSFTIPFTVTGSVSSITSVTVTLVNPTGTSTAATASL